jgi:hypothetical protein
MQVYKIALMGAMNAVILCDVIRSRDHAGFKDLRDATMQRLSSLHLANGWIRMPYAITAWDEFQGLLAGVSFVPRVMWSVIKEFQPLRLRIGVGIGNADIDLTSPAPLNEAATGEAFFRARGALDLTKKGRDPRYDASLHATTGDRVTDLSLNTTLHLLDALIARVTPSQWEAIQAYERLGAQDLVARQLGKAESTVSRALKRAHYWQIVEAVEAMVDLLEIRFDARQNTDPGDCTS